MSLNLNALRRLAESQKSGGNRLFMPVKEIGDGTIIRLIPPSPELNGFFYFLQKVYWINNKPLISPQTFGEQCIIKNYLDNLGRKLAAGKSSGKHDKDLQVLYDKVKNMKLNYMIPILHLTNIEYNEDNKVVKYDVVNEGVRILQASHKLMLEINNVCLSPTLLRRLEGVEDSIANRVKGYNMLISRSGTGFDTIYDAIVDEQCEIDAKYYDNIPSCVSITKKQVYTDDYLKALLDSYFYGGKHPSDEDRVSRYANEEVKEVKDITSTAPTKDNNTNNNTNGVIEKKSSTSNTDFDPSKLEEQYQDGINENNKLFDGMEDLNDLV